VASGWGYQSVVATFIIVVVAYLFVAADFCLYIYSISYDVILQCFDAVGWAAGRASGL